MVQPRNRLRLFGYTFNVHYISFLIVVGTLTTILGLMNILDQRMCLMILVMLSVAMRLMRPS